MKQEIHSLIQKGSRFSGENSGEIPFRFFRSRLIFHNFSFLLGYIDTTPYITHPNQHHLPY